MKEFDKLVDIISQLREECPWDKEQTHESLSKHLIEEAYELLDSLAKLNNNNQESYRNLSSELGDLLLQILLHSKIASENGYFSIVEVVDSLNEKLIKRHPHVFGDVSLDSAKEVEKQWEKIKQEDKQSIFDDINKNLPAITTAFKAQRKAESLNLSYKNYEEALEDLISEIEELKEASSNDEKKYELGDVLFSLVNVSRYIEADPEIQLKKSTERFINRAKYVESNKDDNFIAIVISPFIFILPVIKADIELIFLFNCLFIPASWISYSKSETALKPLNMIVALYLEQSVVVIVENDKIFNLCGLNFKSLKSDFFIISTLSSAEKR